MAQLDLKKVIVTIKDGAGHSLIVKIAEGTLNYTEKKPRKYTLDRGKLGTVMNADEVPVDVKLDFIWENVTATPGSGTPTPSDALKKEGEASTWTSSDTDVCQPYAVDLEFNYDPNCSPTLTEQITISLFRYEDVSMNLKDGTISVTGRANVTEANAARS